MLKNALSTLSLVPWSMGRGGTKRALLLSKALKCPYLQVVGVRGVDIPADQRIIALENPWGSSSLIDGVGGRKGRFRDWVLTGPNENHIVERVTTARKRGIPLVGHSVWLDCDYLEVSRRSGATKDQLLHVFPMPLVLDSFQLIKTPTTNRYSPVFDVETLSTPLEALWFTEDVLREKRNAHIFHFQPYRSSREGLQINGPYEEKSRLQQLSQFLGGVGGYLDEWVRLIASSASQSEQDQSVYMVYELSPAKIYLLPKIIRRVEEIFTSYR